jgi:hypothetical protein
MISQGMLAQWCADHRRSWCPFLSWFRNTASVKAEKYLCHGYLKHISDATGRIHPI